MGKCTMLFLICIVIYNHVLCLISANQIILHVTMEFERETMYLRFLFSLFLNDLEIFLEDKYVTGLESISDDLENQLNIYLILFIILYADDTVILSESESDLHAQLDAFHEYCLTWKLKVNID